jgi:1-acyl-sn-glycerol-3-phosphate acyltransferase
MLDLSRLQRIRLTARPRFQRVVAWALLAPNYRWLPGVKVRFEGLERLPPEPVIFAMNHTDRYNYWPFQFTLWKLAGRFTATWVKGKYYENPVVGRFMEMTNNIPTVSRGYLIARDFLGVEGRAPKGAHYAALRAMVDAQAQGQPLPALDPSLPKALFTRRRDMLGRLFDPAGETYPEAVNGLFRAMMAQFMVLNREAFALGLDLIIFPQGTRSVRLSRGHVGLAQVALSAKRTVVPVGCSGCDRVYPDSVPIARRGEVVYRFGEPIRYEDAAAFHVPPFEPFSAEAERAHQGAFQGYVDAVMEQLNGLVDPPYQFNEDRISDGVQGAERFI